MTKTTLRCNGTTCGHHTRKGDSEPTEVMLSDVVHRRSGPISQRRLDSKSQPGWGQAKIGEGGQPGSTSTSVMAMNRTKVTKRKPHSGCQKLVSMYVGIWSKNVRAEVLESAPEGV